jgi:hypothetical protein
VSPQYIKNGLSAAILVWTQQSGLTKEPHKNRKSHWHPFTWKVRLISGFSDCSGFTRRFVSWEIFKKELLARFGPTKYEDFDEVLSEIKQMETMRDY